MKKVIVVTCFILTLCGTAWANDAEQLSAAAFAGNAATVANLLKKDPHLVNKTTRTKNTDNTYTEKWSALESAVNRNHLDIVKLLVKEGAKVNALDSAGGSALWLAASRGNTEIVGYLIHAGADVNVAFTADGLMKGATPLHSAAAYGHLHITDQLLKAKANVNAVTAQGQTPIWFALKLKHWDIARKLLDVDGINVNCTVDTGITPLMLAVQGNQPGLVKLLLAKGADKAVNSSDGRTALWIAISHQNEEIIEMLKN